MSLEEFNEPGAYMNASSHTRKATDGHSRREQTTVIRRGPDGLHLFWRDIGTHVLVEEIVCPPETWSLAPRNVSIALTNACDLRCTYCYAPKFRSALNLQSVMTWLDELDSHGCMGIGFGGGEPTLYPHLAELCAYAMKHTGMAITMTTHGHWMNQSMLDDLKGNLSFVRVSMDGVGDLYEAHRGRPFDALLERLAHIKTLCPFGINVVINDQTVHELDAILEVIGQVGASELLLLPERPTQKSLGISKLAMAKLRQWTSSYRGTLPLAISEGSTEGFQVCNPLPQEKGLGAYAHIDASGILRRSSFEAEGLSLEDHSFMETLKSLQSL